MTRPRLRELGIAIGRHPCGPLNAITDVAGVSVGHSTVRDGDRIRTGATAILPHGGNLFQDKVPAGLAVLNGFGKLAGATQLRELGEIETPILLTNTLATGRAVEASLAWTLRQPGNERVTSVNPIVGETNDSRLNDIRAGRPTTDEIAAALSAARPGSVAEGAVGAGTGTVAFGLKGGIGTASRRAGAWTLGVLVQSNFGGLLRIDGRPVSSDPAHDRDGSIMIVLATDAPLGDRNLRRLAERAFGGLARTGAALSNGSGDYAIAFSTSPSARRTPDRRAGPAMIEELGNDAMSPLFECAIEAAEEAILNSLCAAEDTDGWNTAEARPAHIPALAIPLRWL
ncbi:P1 family peptidase [Falsirhodobacter algicola]|uniref:S58 family peptidase n=1 Tax=Falsirhodobacter algicola TaxID=2692330 RepID=A0A8J8MQN0_9RHOB|nr:P1 family peptidase [Falsirhodobacter algicola]QUS34910.1 S58 family peptidase [Falsirhodobacter algicola]